MQFGRRGEDAIPDGDSGRAGSPATLPFLAGGGDLGELIRGHDWSTSPLGPPERWPQSLRSVVGLLLGSRFPMFVAWGPELGFLYNDAYAEILGGKHPAALGARFQDIWAEIWPDILPLIEAALRGEASYRDNLRLVMNRRGHEEETWFTFSYSPVRDESGAVAGMFCACTETTDQVRLAAELRAQRDRSEGVLEHMAEAFGLLDDDLRILSLNAEAVRLDGRPREALVGRLHRDVYPEAHALEALYRTVLDEGRAVELEHVYRFPDGRETCLDMRAYPLPERRLAIFWRDVTERRKAAVQLAEGEARLRALTDHLPGGMVYQIAVASDGSRRFAYVSQSIEALLGLSAEAVLADAGLAYAAIHPEDREALAAAEQEAVASGGPFDARVRFIRADGAVIWCRLISTPRQQADGGTVWDGLQIDISSEKRAEEALREREARLRLALDAGRMAEVMFDIPAGTVVHGSAFARLLGLASDRKLSLADLRAVYHPDDLNRVLAERRAILESDQTDYEVEHRIVRPDGEVRWIYGRGRVSRDPDGTARTVTAVYLDETKRRAAETALRKTESQLRLIADALPVLISHMGPDLRYRFVNKAYEEWFGLPHQSLIGKTVAEIVGPAAFARVEPLIRRVLAGERLAVEQSMPYQHGGTRHVHTEFVPAVAPDGTPDGYYALIQDVSDARKAADALQQLAETLEQRVSERTAELEQAYEQLRQSQKLEAMGQLTGGVAHDFNNLLTPIVGALDLLQRKDIGTEREQRLIAGALQSAERAKLLVQRLLAFARRQPLRPIAVDVAALVEGMADLVASTSGPQIRVKVEMPPGLPPAKADPNQLEMAVLNLSVNARDAMPDGGTLTIAANAERVGSERKHKLAPGCYVRLSVSDTGVGMDKETLARAIEPFFSTKGIGKGTGLGLSMVHGLASQLGGALTLSSKAGLGTTAELWLPVSDLEAEGTEGRPAEAEAQPPSGRVLLVDDEDVVRKSTAAMLAELGYQVTEADSAEAALPLLGDGIDLLVTDHLMPGMSGADLVRQAQALRPGLPALIITGYAEVEAIAPDLPRLAKPFRQDELAARIAALQQGG
jgi:PAS domain S-box-containing protein